MTPLPRRTLEWMLKVKFSFNLRVRAAYLSSVIVIMCLEANRGNFFF